MTWAIFHPVRSAPSVTDVRLITYSFQRLTARAVNTMIPSHGCGGLEGVQRQQGGADFAQPGEHAVELSLVCDLLDWLRGQS